MSTELMLGLGAAVLLVLVLAVAGVVMYLVAKLPKDAAFMDALTRAAYEIDRFADEMEQPGKRATMAVALTQVLGWKRIFIPNIVLNWIIGLLVGAVRKMQELTGCPDLHKEDAPNG